MYGSLPGYGALIEVGSLMHVVTILACGSLASHGALVRAGSLLTNGTLGRDDSLCRFGALPDSGSLTFPGALVTLALARLQRRSRLTATRSSAMALSELDGSLTSSGALAVSTARFLHTALSRSTARSNPSVLSDFDGSRTLKPFGTRRPRWLAPLLWRSLTSRARSCSTALSATMARSHRTALSSRMARSYNTVLSRFGGSLCFDGALSEVDSLTWHGALAAW